jgi:hypothetical protein
MAEVFSPLVWSTYGEVRSVWAEVLVKIAQLLEKKAELVQKTRQHKCASDMDMGLRVRAGKYASPLDTWSSLVMRY